MMMITKDTTSSATSDRRVGPSTKPIDRRPQRILVAEDSYEMRRLIATTLEAQGYDVVEARDGMELLDLIEASAQHGPDERYAAVISDVRMPWLSGMDVMAILNAASWPTPMILITAFGDDETHAEGRDLGEIAVLDKPFEMEQLTTILAGLVAGGGM